MFALVLGLHVDAAAQWQWGYLDVRPYALVALVAFVLGRRVLRREHLVRLRAARGSSLVGAVFVPLGLEAHWRHAQPEVGVIERAGELICARTGPLPRLRRCTAAW